MGNTRSKAPKQFVETAESVFARRTTNANINNNVYETIDNKISLFVTNETLNMNFIQVPYLPQYSPKLRLDNNENIQLDFDEFNNNRLSADVESYINKINIESKNVNVRLIYLNFTYFIIYINNFIFAYQLVDEKESEKMAFHIRYKSEMKLIKTKYNKKAKELPIGRIFEHELYKLLDPKT